MLSETDEGAPFIEYFQGLKIFTRGNFLEVAEYFAHRGNHQVVDEETGDPDLQTM
jgi:hypothetical protein